MKIGVVNVIQDDNKVKKFTISLQKTAGNTSNRMPKFVGQKALIIWNGDKTEIDLFLSLDNMTEG